jgi:dTDP-4-dehydrorhamnose 3,5-epimerase
VDPERREDERGFFARTFCQREFEAQGRSFRPVQCSTSFNARRHTLRGLHYQADPPGEDKLVRCTRGAIFDVAVDLRPESSTFLRVVTVTLSPDNGRQLFIPRGCAHGFLTLAEDAEVEYMMTEFFVPEAARGVRWNDPMLAIAWPAPPEVLSDRDHHWPDLR